MRVLHAEQQEGGQVKVGRDPAPLQEFEQAVPPELLPSSFIPIVKVAQAAIKN